MVNVLTKTSIVLLKWHLCGVLLLTLGCTQTRLTTPKRSAVEQLLISTAADRALAQLEASAFNGKKVYLDTTYFESEDKGYVIGTIRDILSAHGALLVNDSKEAQIIIEARSGALSIDNSESLVGLPKMPLAIPFAGTIQTPEIPLFKTEKQFSTAKLALLAYEQQSRKHFHSSGHLVGKAHHSYYTLLGYIKLTSTSLPEKQRKK